MMLPARLRPPRGVDDHRASVAEKMHPGRMASWQGFTNGLWSCGSGGCGAVVTSPSAVIFSTAMLTGKAPWTSMRPTSATLAVLFHHPEFFQNFVELLLIGHRENFLGGDLAVMQLDAAVG